MSDTFPTLCADPPWPEVGGGKSKRGADRHYKVMKPKQIVETLLSCEFWRPAEDAHLYMWVTNNWLEAGLGVIRDVGFRYVTNISWVKQNDCGELQSGLGQYFRGEHEMLLFAVRGKGFEVRTDRRDIGSVLRAPRTVHSRKPEEAYALIEARSRGPYVEFFARRSRRGWVSWGDQVMCETTEAGQISLWPEKE